MLRTARSTWPLAAAGTLLASALSVTGCIDKTLVGGTSTSSGTGGSDTSAGGGGMTSTGSNTGGSGSTGGSSGGAGGSTGNGGSTTTGSTTTGVGGSGPMTDGWARAFGDVERQEGWDVAVDGSGNIVVSGSMQGTMQMDGVTLSMFPPQPMKPWGQDIFVAKLDPTGAVLWAKTFGNGHLNDGYDVAVDPSGNVLLAGGFVGPLDFGGGPIGATTNGTNLFVVKLDPNGNHLWSKDFGDTALQPQFPSCKVESDANGNILLAGQFMGTLDFGGAPLSTGGTFQADVYVAKLDPGGNHLYSKRFGDTEPMGVASERVHSLTVDSAGAVVIAGDMDGTIDFGGGVLSSNSGAYVAKLDAQGNHVWSRVFGNYGASFTAHGVTPQGNILLAGYFNDLIDYGGGEINDADGSKVLVELDSSGQLVWFKQWAGDFWCNDIVSSPSGHLAVVGYTQDVLDLTALGGDVLPSFENWPNAAILMMDEDGALLAARNYSAPSAVNSPSRELMGAAFDPQGYLITTGMFEGELDMGYGTFDAGEKSNVVIAKLPQSLMP